MRWQNDIGRKSLGNPRFLSKIAERLFIPNNYEFVTVLKLNEAVAQNRIIHPYHKRVDRRLSDIQKCISLAPERTRVFIRPQESGKHCHRCHLFYGKGDFHSENEEVWSLYDLKPTSSEYLFGGNINESLKLAKGNYKLSQNLVSAKSRNKVELPSSRAGFKRRPDHFFLEPSSI